MIPIFERKDKPKINYKGYPHGLGNIQDRKALLVNCKNNQDIANLVGAIRSGLTAITKEENELLKKHFGEDWANKIKAS